MKVIKEYQLFRKRDLLELPKFSQVLSLELKDGVKTMWVEVDPSVTEQVIRRFEMYETGEDIPVDEDLNYLGTLENLHIVERVDLNTDN